jgi:3-deoxy-manno-octulosonate cytidylyltransferase (CMP-KDO synthetase)
MSSTPDFIVVIPARFASTRLPGKPLRLLHGKPMIQWVYQAAVDSGAADVVVATDDNRIVQAVEAFGGDCQLTSSNHQTGTDRIVEVCNARGWSDERIIVNLQGDEPLMASSNLAQVATNLLRSERDMATLHKPIEPRDAQDPNLVKLVHDRSGRALYFSRAPIPYRRDAHDPAPQYRGHIGLYAYRVGFLKTYARLAPAETELSEKLEQLRALDHGYSIHTETASVNPGPGVDTEQDLQQVEMLMAQGAP